MASASSAARTLMNELKDLQKNRLEGTIVNADEGNIFRWEVGLAKTNKRKG